jgi:hypothetical protein
MDRATLEWMLETMQERVRFSIQLSLPDSPEAIAYRAGLLDATNLLIENVGEKLKDVEAVESWEKFNGTSNT